MGVYIKGMEMPKKQVYAILNPNGLVEVLDANNVLLEEYQAAPVPPHGRLIDAGNLGERAFRYLLMNGEESPKVVFAQAIKDAPTILEAEEGE